MSKAVVKIGTSQYQVTEGQEVLINLIPQTEGKLTFSNVLFLESEGQIQVGQPFVNGASIEAEILGSEKGEKVRVSKFKAKSRYRKTVGFRPKHTRIKVISIKTSGGSLDSEGDSKVEKKSKSTTKSKSKSSEKKA